MRITCDDKCELRAALFFLSILVVWFAGFVAPVFHTVDSLSGWRMIWFAMYLWLSFWTATTFVTYLVSAAGRQPRCLPEVRDVSPGTLTAIVCPVRNEDATLLLQRLRHSLAGNVGPAIHFWLLSDSDKSQGAVERALVSMLRDELPHARIFYRRRATPRNQKPGNIRQWLMKGGRHFYQYFFVLDADSYIASGTVARLLRKAQHPRNQDVMIFQAATQIYNDHTPFSLLSGIGIRIGRRLQFPALWNVTNQFMSWGHNNLIRTAAWLTVDPPADKRYPSHDVSDAAHGDKHGFRTAYIPDVVTFEESPSNPLAASKRARRWMRGSLRSLALLLDRDISLAQKAYILIGGVDFINMPTFLIWLVCGLVMFPNVPEGQGGPPASFALRFSSLLPLVLTWITYFGMPLCAARSTEEFLETVWFILASTLMLLHSIVDGTIGVLKLLFDPPTEWLSMGHSQARQPSAWNLFRHGIPSFLVALLLWLLMGVAAPSLTWCHWMIMPVVLGGMLTPWVLVWASTDLRDKKGALPI